MIEYVPAAAIGMSVIGTLMIFLFGMPFRVKPEPVLQAIGTSIVIEPTRRAILSNTAFDALSWIGLLLAIGGGGIQFCLALP